MATWEAEAPSTAVHTTPAVNSVAPYEVRLLDDHDASSETLACLLHPGSLRILQLSKIPSDDVFEDLMRLHGPYLRSLRVKSLPDECASSLVHCTAMEEFKCLSIPSPSVLFALPATIEHISFQNCTMQPRAILGVVEWIQERAPRLRMVTYNCCGRPDNTDFRTLATICRSKHIELRCFADASPTREVCLNSSLSPSIFFACR